MGFYITRFVTADNLAEAEVMAVKTLTSDKNLQKLVLNKSKHIEAKVHLDELHEIQEKDIEDNYGLGWYSMKDIDD